MSGEIRPISHCADCDLGLGSIARDPKECQEELGPEWNYAGMDKCGSCSYRLMGIFPLARATCRHVRYSAPKSDCCTGRHPSSSKLTCNPKYRPDNPECDIELDNYCIHGDRMLNDKSCKTWRQSGSNRAQVTYRDYCRLNLDKEECKDWCKRTNECDVEVEKWCERRVDDPFCACYHSKIRNKNEINPACYDEKCVNGGYIPNDMKRIPCAPVCNIAVQLMNEGVMLSSKINIDQICGSTGNNGNNSGTGNTGNTVNPGTGNPGSIGNPGIIDDVDFDFIEDVILIAVIVIAALIIIASYYLFDSNTSNELVGGLMKSLSVEL
jgi:hypothetical protein